MESKDNGSRSGKEDSKNESKSPGIVRKGRRERNDENDNTSSANDTSTTDQQIVKPRRKPGTEGDTNNTQETSNNWMMSPGANDTKTTKKKVEDEPIAIK